jgi:hypothetical protein
VKILFREDGDIVFEQSLSAKNAVLMLENLLRNQKEIYSIVHDDKEIEFTSIEFELKNV